ASAICGERWSALSRSASPTNSSSRSPAPSSARSRSSCSSSCSSRSARVACSRSRAGRWRHEHTSTMQFLPREAGEVASAASRRERAGSPSGAGNRRSAPSAGFAGTSPASRGRIIEHDQLGGGSRMSAFPHTRALDRGASAFLLLLIAIAIAVPFANLILPPTSPFHVSTYLVTLWGKYICFALLALSIDLIWGYCGILSLGHGAFFAL